MVMKIKDLTGQRFGRLVVQYMTDKRVHGAILFHCICDCGKEKEVLGINLRNGGTKSCGCLNRELSTANIMGVKKLVENTDLSRVKLNRKSKTNTSGYVGVSWDGQRKKWVAQIKLRGIGHRLGRYDNLQDAIDARKAGEEKYFKPILDKYGVKQ